MKSRYVTAHVNYVSEGNNNNKESQRKKNFTWMSFQMPQSRILSHFFSSLNKVNMKRRSCILYSIFYHHLVKKKNRKNVGKVAVSPHFRPSLFRGEIKQKHMNAHFCLGLNIHMFPFQILFWINRKSQNLTHFRYRFSKFKKKIYIWFNPYCCNV